MISTVIAGIGSPFGADRIGWAVIDYLHANLESRDTEIKLVKLDRPATELLIWIRDAERAIIIDAIQGGWEQGRVIRLQGEDIYSGENYLSSHGFGLAGTLSLGRQLGLLPGDLHVIGLEVTADMNWEPQAQQIADLAHTVKVELARCRLPY